METANPYKEILTDLIKKQMVMLGPNVALAQVRKVEGIQVGDDGVVTEITGDPQKVLAGVAKAYLALSGAITQMTLDSLIAKYPGVKME